jgi:hypothetical protein
VAHVRTEPARALVAALADEVLIDVAEGREMPVRIVDAEVGPPSYVATSS